MSGFSVSTAGTHILTSDHSRSSTVWLGDFWLHPASQPSNHLRLQPKEDHSPWHVHPAQHPPSLEHTPAPLRLLQKSTRAWFKVHPESQCCWNVLLTTLVLCPQSFSPAPLSRNSSSQIGLIQQILGGQSLLCHSVKVFPQGPENALYKGTA